MPASDIQTLFNRIAPSYDQLNDQLSFGLHRIWKRMTVKWAEAKRGDICLDLCCGSGDLAILLADQVGRSGLVYGVDFAADLLAIARQRSQKIWPHPATHPRIIWHQGDALNLEFPDRTFDAVTIGYGLRNVGDISRCLAELWRVLKPGAKAAILDFHRPQDPSLQRLQTWYLQQRVVPLAHQLGLTDEYAYILPSVERFPIGSEQVQLARSAGFCHAVHYPLVQGMMGVLVLRK